MKTIIALILSIFMGAAFAQVTDAPPVVCGKSGGYNLNYGATIDPLGGFWATWWCRDTSDPYAPWTYNYGTAYLPALMGPEIERITAALTSKNYADAVAARNRPSDSEVVALIAVQAVLLPPPPGPWVVKSAPVDRPVYAVVGGVRQTVALAGVRAAKGLNCACHQSVLVEGTSTFCPVAGRPIDQVTLCQKAPVPLQ